MIDAVALGVNVTFFSLFAALAFVCLMEIYAAHCRHQRRKRLAKPRSQDPGELIPLAREDVQTWIPPSQRGKQPVDLTNWAKGTPDVCATEHHPDLWKCPDDAWPVFRGADRHPWIEVGEGKFAFWKTLHHETMHTVFTEDRRRPERLPWQDGLKA